MDGNVAVSTRLDTGERPVRLHVHVGDAGVVLVSTDGSATLAAVAEGAVQRMRRLKPDAVADGHGAKELRLSPQGPLLDGNDRVAGLLHDDEHLYIITGVGGTCTDTSTNGRPSSNEVSPLVSPKHQAPKRSRTISNCSEESVLMLPNNTRDAVALHRAIGQGFTKDVLIITGGNLNTKVLYKISKGYYSLKLSNESRQRVDRSRKLLDEIVEENRVVYGVTTGFGNFANVVVSKEKILELQQNLIRSHACGVGQPLSLGRTRMLLALRINVLAKGYSGISTQNLDRMIAAFNAGCLSLVPQQGTVGCSGDLAPLAHLALGLMGEGLMWSPKTGWAEAASVLAANDLQPIVLHAKEGIAMINGTQMVTSMAAEESHRFCSRVQDAYTLRCVPQVHGVVHDTIAFARSIIDVELNSATDNPLVFADRGEIKSGGNFHGEYPAKALDYIAIAVHELAQMSERRFERLNNPALSGLPDFLAKDGGVNSGLMMVQVTAASLVSENKVLVHPSSADSIPTSANQEDHVSMGGFAARKAIMVLDNVENVLAMELMAACQGMEFLKPLTTTAPLQKVYNLVRQVSPYVQLLHAMSISMALNRAQKYSSVERDRYFAPEIAAIARLLRDSKVWLCVKPHLDECKQMTDGEMDEFGTGPDSPTGVVIEQNGDGRPLQGSLVESTFEVFT